MDTHTGLQSPRGIWWKPAHKAERMWVGIAFGWCMVLFAMMPLWHIRGGQNPAGIRSRTDAGAYYKRTMEFIKAYQVGVDHNIPVVAPPPGADIYLMAQQFQWTPVLRLQLNTEYTLHLSALDVNHGFSLFPVNVNFQVVPGYDYGLRVKPTESGDFRIICNEFCGIGHHTMVGRVTVTDGTGRELQPGGAAQ